MTDKKTVKLAALATLVALNFSAKADVIDFNGLAGTYMPGATWVADGLYTYFDHPSTVGGYTFSTPNDAHWYAGVMNSIIFCGGSSVDCANNGTDYLLSQPHLVINRSNGGTFNLNALDLDNFYDGNNNPARSYLLTGKLANGSTITRTLTLDDVPNSVTSGTAAAFNHFTFPEFKNLTQVDIVQQDIGNWGGFALDNLDVSNVSAVPEPSAWAMLSVGMAGLLWARKKRRA